MCENVECGRLTNAECGIRNTELIRRQDVEKAIQGLHTGDVRFFEKLRKNIDAIPSAEPERKKGEWVKEDLSGYLTPGGNSIYHCSECGHTEGPYPHPRLTDFCPNCGADMRGE